MKSTDYLLRETGLFALGSTVMAPGSAGVGRHDSRFSREKWGIRLAKPCRPESHKK
jgi:hypothetical protein